MPSDTRSGNTLRGFYEEFGVDAYYEHHAGNYVNPHERHVQSLVRQADALGVLGNRVLDLCCGSGEVTRCLPHRECTGVDPYLGRIYSSRTGRPVFDWSFRDIAMGRLTGQYDSVICSFALHLCPLSLLPQVLWNLARLSAALVVLSPHKRPDCDGVALWTCVHEAVEERVRMRIYLGITA